MTRTLHTDIVIIGGGIAGLWLINVLTARGFSCVLLERDSLGGGQTLLSQGIIHGGLKYALGGALSSESEAIAGMPDRWRGHLRGTALPDLSTVPVLSETQHLWSAGSMASRFTTFFASRMLRGRIEKLRFDDYPSALRDRRFRGSVYRMDDLVLDAEQLVRALAAPVADRLLRVALAPEMIEWSPQGIAAITLAGGHRLLPRHTILAAGAGNRPLLDAAHEHGLCTDVAMQLRPLHMLMVRHRLGHRLYAHCIGASNKPRLTVTSHPTADGDTVWYLGGDLAERGVEMTPERLIDAGRRELHELFPWLDFTEAEFSTLRIDRAEPRQASLAKPDNAWARRDRDLTVAWPTKLTLAPDLGDRVLALLDDLAPGAAADALPAELPRARPGRAHWQREAS